MAIAFITYRLWIITSKIEWEFLKEIILDGLTIFAVIAIVGANWPNLMLPLGHRLNSYKKYYESTAQACIFAIAGFFLLAHFLWPNLPMDNFTLILILILTIPFLRSLIDSLDFPGGGGIKFRTQQALERMEAKASSIPIAPSDDAVSEPTFRKKDEKRDEQYAFQSVVDDDPALALAGLRIEIEKRLLALAQQGELDVRNKGIGGLSSILSRRMLLSNDERSILRDLTNLMNLAVHGGKIDNEDAKRAIDVGVSLLGSLDVKLDRSGHERRQEFEWCVARIREKIAMWGLLPELPVDFEDSIPFSIVGSGITASLIKKDGQIKIRTSNAGDLDISVEELTDRIGIGIQFLSKLERRLDAFKILLDEASGRNA